MSARQPLQFVDTNVLLYAYDLSTGTKRQQAKQLLEQLWQSRLGCLSIQVLQEFYFSATRKLARPIGYREACQVVQDLSTWQVYSPVSEDVLGAARISRERQVSFWDAMILQSAARLGCGLVWSEDLAPGQSYDGISVANPFAACA